MYKKALESTSIYDKVESIRNSENYTTLDDIPDIYEQAVVAVEDHRFYNHGAIDLISITRAAITNIKAGSLVEGGSTLTQQLCKNIFFSQEKTFERKIAEIFMATDLERAYSKNEILELYINTCYYGDGYYSIKDAAMGYFNKKVSEMSDFEAILLAGIPNAPSRYSPTKNPELSKERMQVVLYALVKHNYITYEESSKILLDSSI